MRQHVRPMRILFADDETSIQELMRIELPRLGHEATVCPDGRTAEIAVSSDDFPVMITVSVSGDVSRTRPITSMPPTPGMSRSTITQS